MVAFEGMPDEVFEPEPGYEGKPSTIGELAEAYLITDTGRLNANRKIRAICLASLRCTLTSEVKDGR